MELKLPFGVAAGAFQLLFLVLFAVFANYDPKPYSIGSWKNDTNPDENLINDVYPMFQDVHVMMFMGFGYLMTFLRRYGFSSVGINMLITVFVLQWTLLVGGFFSFVHHPKERTFSINIIGLLNADFAAATVLITFGAVLGKTSPLQMIFVSFIEIVVFKTNEFIGLDVLKVTDIGGSMFVHVFGAYFGLALSRVIYKNAVKEHGNEASIYHSDMFAMIGTLFLWMYWPSFNAALASGDLRHRAVINTYISLAACCLTTFAVSSCINNKKFDMVHIQNATLAGGVAVGTSADMMLYPGGAAAVGILSGTLSVLGYKFLTPFLSSKLKIHDTCGVNNLHGMPGLIAGIVGTILAAVAQESQYNYSLYEVFPQRAPNSGQELARIQAHLPSVKAGAGRTAGEQAGYQIAALAMTFVVAITSGSLTGLILKFGVFGPPEDDYLYDDVLWWETPEDFPSAHAAQTFPGHAGTSTSEPRRGSIMALTVGNEGEEAPTQIQRL